VADSVVWLWLRRPGLHSFLKNGSLWKIRLILQTLCFGHLRHTDLLRYHRRIGFLND